MSLSIVSIYLSNFIFKFIFKIIVNSHLITIHITPHPALEYHHQILNTPNDKNPPPPTHTWLIVIYIFFLVYYCHPLSSFVRSHHCVCNISKFNNSRTSLFRACGVIKFSKVPYISNPNYYYYYCT